MLPRTERIINRILSYLLILCGLSLVGVVLIGKTDFLMAVFLLMCSAATIATGIQILYTATLEAAKEKAYIEKEMEG